MGLSFLTLVARQLFTTKQAEKTSDSNPQGAIVECTCDLNQATTLFDKEPVVREISQVDRHDAERCPSLAITGSHCGNESTTARDEIAAERRMTFAGCCRQYPRAMAWSVVVALTIVMEAYDKILVSSFYASPPFREQYGKPIPGKIENGKQAYEISASWQTGITVAPTCAEILGLFMNGYLTEKFGYRKILLYTLTFMNLAIFVTFFSVSKEMLLVSQFLCGFPWGIIQTCAATYAADILPANLRGYLLANVNMAWLIGQVTATGVVRAMVNNSTKWSYRIPFALEWVWAAPLLIAVCFAPESPWWLIRHNEFGKARQALLRLTRRDRHNIDRTVVMMIHTNKVEKRLDNGQGTTYFDCFRGTNLRRTEIACLVWLTQAWCGATLSGYASYFFQNAGFNVSHSFSLAVGMFGLAILGNVIAWFLLAVIGRRTLYIWGLALSVIILATGGFVAVFLGRTEHLNWILGALLIFMTWVYDMTIGPVCYVLVAEIPSTRLRVKTVVLARSAYSIGMIISNTIVTRMLNPTAWDWKGKSCFLYAVTALLFFGWCYFRLPETKGLAYLELDILFEKKASARSFAKLQKRLAETGYFSLEDNGRPGSRWHGWQGYN